MYQLPIEKRTEAGATRLSSSAALFVPRWCSIGQPTAFMPPTGSMADAGSLDVAWEGLPAESQVDPYLHSMPVGDATQVAESIGVPYPTTCEHHSEVDATKEETEVDADSSATGGLQDMDLHESGENPYPTSGEHHSEVDTTKEETEVDADSSTTGGIQDTDLHESGENTSAASTGSIKNAMQFDTLPLMAITGDKTPSLYDSPRFYSDDPVVFPATPDEGSVASDLYGLGDRSCLMAESPLLPTSLPSMGQFASTPEPCPSTLPGLVLVQVPLQVQCDANAPLSQGPAYMNVKMLSQEMDAQTGAVSLHLRLVLSPPGVCPEDFSPMCTPASEQPPQQSEAQATLSKKRATPSTIAAKNRDMVCCHWKTKGWCRYEDSCRFMHLEAKRGMGGSAVEETGDAN
eukprot:CAMPEP_0172866726 /NCGR_PEP_ID=MMETSP1075-20121228/82152_1 /TAXON_ID=2916 /ORGANISM="Ceratium fusus, Strain PA161109" /LENGTH=402 /DNA_ID=CAMNT_0013715923 /DNA_START=15 /DNA_END=1223 /DNA_ORIENTATION=-